MTIIISDLFPQLLSFCQFVVKYLFAQQKFAVRLSALTTCTTFHFPRNAVEKEILDYRNYIPVMGSRRVF